MTTPHPKGCTYIVPVVCLIFCLPSLCLASERAAGEPLWSIIFKFVNLAILVAIIYRLGAKKIEGFFKDRRQKARNAIDAAIQKEEEASRLLKEWKDKIAGAEEEARNMVEASVAEGRSLKEGILQGADEEARAAIEQAKIVAAMEMKKILELLKKELAAISAEKAEALLREKVDAGHQKRLVEEFIHTVEGLS